MVATSRPLSTENAAPYTTAYAAHCKYHYTVSRPQRQEGEGRFWFVLYLFAAPCMVYFPYTALFCCLAEVRRAGGLL